MPHPMNSGAAGRALQRQRDDRFRCERRSGIAAALALALAPLGGCVIGAPEHAGFVDLVRLVSPAVVGVGDDRGVTGSGFRIVDSRFVVTAAHVLASARGSPLVIWEEKRWPVRLVRVDTKNDLALLELPPDAPMPGLALVAGAAAPVAGAWIVVLGRPFGGKTTATFGIISATPGTIGVSPDLLERIQVNAAINPGNSGGPIVNLRGEVVGVASALLPSGQGLAFAIPASAVAGLLPPEGR
jgi:S1-C subfamily serine protease